MKKFLSILLTVLIVLTVGTVNVMGEEVSEEVHNAYMSDEYGNNALKHLWVAQGESVSVKVYTHQEGSTPDTWESYYYRLESTSNGDSPLNNNTPDNDCATASSNVVYATNDGTNSLSFTGVKVGTTKFVYRERSSGDDLAWSGGAADYWFEFDVHVYSKPTLVTDDLYYSEDNQSLLATAGTAPDGYTVKYAVVAKDGSPVDADWTDDAANVVKKAVGDYDVYWKIDEGSEPTSVVSSLLGTVSIKKANKDITFENSSVELVQKGIDQDAEFTAATIKNRQHPDATIAVTKLVYNLDQSDETTKSYIDKSYFKLATDSSDNKIKVSKYTPAGEYVVKVIASAAGTKSYSKADPVTVDVTITIKKADLKDVTVIFNSTDIESEDGNTKNNRYYYIDNKIKPEVRLVLGDITLVPGEDYEIGGNQERSAVGTYYLNIFPVETSKYIGSEQDLADYNVQKYEERKWYIFDSKNLANFVEINGVLLSGTKSDNYYVDNVELTYNSKEQFVTVAAPSLVNEEKDIEPTIKYSLTGAAGSYETKALGFGITDVPENESQSIKVYYEVARSGFISIHGIMTIKMNKADAYVLPIYEKVDICDFKLSDYPNNHSKVGYKTFIIENSGTEKENWIEVEIKDVTKNSNAVYTGVEVSQSVAFSASNVYPGAYYSGVCGTSTAKAGSNLYNNYKDIIPYNRDAHWFQPAVVLNQNGKVSTDATTGLPVLTEKQGAFEITADLSKATVTTESQTYDGTLLTPVPVVTFKTADDITVTIKSADYQLGFSFIPFVNAGTYYYNIFANFGAKYITGAKYMNTFVIDPRPIVVEWTNKKDMYYNGLHQQDDPTITNLVNNVLNMNVKDTCEVEFAYAKDTGTGKGDSLEETIDAGKYYVTITGVKNPNYTVVDGENLEKQYEILPMLIQVAFKYNDNANFFTNEVNVANMVHAVLINEKIVDEDGSNLTVAEKEIWDKDGLDYAFYKYPYDSVPTTDFSEKGLYGLCIVIPKAKFDTGNYQIEILQKMGVTFGDTSKVTNIKDDLNEDSYVLNEFYVVDAYNNIDSYGKELFGMIIKHVSNVENGFARYTDYSYFNNLVKYIEDNLTTELPFDLGEPKFVLTLNTDKVTDADAKAKIKQIANGKKYSAIEVTPTVQIMADGVIKSSAIVENEEPFINSNTSLELTFPVDKKINGNRRTYTLYHLVWDEVESKYVIDKNVSKTWTVSDASSGKVKVTTTSTTSPFFVVWNDWTESSPVTKPKAVVNTSLD